MERCIKKFIQKNRKFIPCISNNDIENNENIQNNHNLHVLQNTDIVPSIIKDQTETDGNIFIYKCNNQTYYVKGIESIKI
tara:strand:+ start:684 stop:923 length:240 start_codon:yes stop_codon:yes gene_type:complete